MLKTPYLTVTKLLAVIMIIILYLNQAGITVIAIYFEPDLHIYTEISLSKIFTQIHDFSILMHY